MKIESKIRHLPGEPHIVATFKLFQIFFAPKLFRAEINGIPFPTTGKSLSFWHGVAPFSTFQWTLSEIKLCQGLEDLLAVHLKSNPAQ